MNLTDLTFIVVSFLVAVIFLAATKQQISEYVFRSDEAFARKANRYMTAIAVMALVTIAVLLIVKFGLHLDANASFEKLFQNIVWLACVFYFFPFGAVIKCALDNAFLTPIERQSEKLLWFFRTSVVGIIIVNILMMILVAYEYLGSAR